jgi:hypothetical protein
LEYKTFKIHTSYAKHPLSRSPTYYKEPSYVISHLHLLLGDHSPSPTTKLLQQRPNQSISNQKKRGRVEMFKNLKR